MKQADARIRAFGINGVPAMIVPRQILGGFQLRRWQCQHAESRRFSD